MPDWIRNPIPSIETDKSLSGKCINLEYDKDLEGKYALITSGQSTRIAVLRDGKANFVNPK